MCFSAFANPFTLACVLFYQGIHEFTDVDDDEKKFLLTWNDHFRQRTWVLPATKPLVDQLYTFLGENLDALMDITQQILLKLLNLVDHRMISDAELEQLMTYFQNLVHIKKTKGNAQQNRTIGDQKPSLVGEGTISFPRAKAEQRTLEGGVVVGTVTTASSPLVVRNSSHHHTQEEGHQESENDEKPTVALLKQPP